MSYKSILVNIDIDGPIVPVVKAALDLARRSEAKLIGICAADVSLPMVVEEGSALVAKLWEQMRGDVEKRLKDVHSEFNRLTAGSVETEWRADVTNPTHAIVAASRLADLVVMAASEGASTGDAYRAADPASVVLRAGRPLLVVASKAEQVPARKVVVAWKDTREARRAVADVVPLLASADEVTVLTVAGQADQWVREGLTDVVAFLAAHGVEAKPKLIESPDEYVTLFKFIDESDADLVVSGAYGHSRLREWVFGGVTRSLLDESGRNRFMSS
jgi:nucleotide-binding universal stress UspA family protein